MNTHCSGGNSREGFIEVGRNREQREEAAHFEDITHGITHAGEHQLSLDDAKFLASQQDDAQSCRTDVIQAGEIEDQALAAPLKALEDGPLKFGRRSAVEATHRTDDGNVTADFEIEIHAEPLLLNTRVLF